MATYSDILCAQIILKNGVATESVLRECFEEQSREQANGGQGRDIVTVLMDRNVLSPDQAKKIYKAQALHQFIKAEKVYAQVAMEKNYVSRENLERAFEIQKQQGYSHQLSQILIGQGLLTPSQNEEIFVRQTELLDDITQQETRDFESSISFGAASSDSGRLGPSESSIVRMGAEQSQNIQYHASESVRSPAPEEVPSDPNDPLIGRTVADRYRILSKLGEGGMGSVYLAEHVLMEKKIAFKVIHPELIDSEETLLRFKREVKAASRFAHRNVVQIYDAGEADGIYYMAMEYVKGRELTDIIAEEGAVPIKRTLIILRQVLSAMEEAHKKKIVHRDMKSENIMIMKGRNGEDIVKVMDFGIAKILEHGMESQFKTDEMFKTQAGVVTGTPQYMSPEQASGGKVDNRTDIYSLGIIAYEMVAGRLPFDSPTPMGYLGKHIVEPPPSFRQLVPSISVPRELEAIIMRALEKKRDDRYETAGAMLADLDERVTPAYLSLQGGAIEESGARDPSAFDRLRFSAKRAVATFKEKVLGNPLHLAIFIGATVTLLVTTILVAAVLIINATDLESRIQTAIKTSNELLASAESREDFEAARKAMQTVLAEDPDHPLVLEQLGKVDEEVEAFEAFQKKKKKFDAAVARGDNALKEGRLQDARQHYETARSILKEDDDAQQLVIDRLQEVAIEEDKTTQDAEWTELVERGDRAMDAEDWATALKYFRKARTLHYTPLLEKKIDAAEARQAVEKGDRAMARKMYDDAVRAYEVAREKYAGEFPDLDEKLARARKLRNEHLNRKERLKQVRSTLEEASALEEKREYTKALKKLEEAKFLLRDGESPELLEDVDARIARLEERTEEEALYRKATAFEAKIRKRDASAIEPADLTEVANLYRAYLDEHPEGDYADDARKAAERVEEERLALKQKLREEAEERDKKRKADLERLMKTARDLEEKGRIDDAIARLELAKDTKVKTDEEKERVEAELNRLRRRLELLSKLPDRDRLVFVKGGPVRVGGAETNPEREIPHLDAFYIGKFEVTKAEYMEYCKATQRPFPGDKPLTTRTRDHPVVKVSHADAEAYCKWLTQENPGFRFRLPTEVEWEKAAGWNPDDQEMYDYPWGDDFNADYCNFQRSDLKAVGTYPRGKSPYGLLDCTGNVWEWVAGPYKNHQTGEENPNKRIIKGGSYLSFDPKDLRIAHRLAVDPGEQQPDRGFRIVVEILDE